MKELCDSTNKTYDLDALSPCTHEEADMRMFVHAHDASLILIGSHVCSYFPTTLEHF